MHPIRWISAKSTLLSTYTCGMLLPGKTLSVRTLVTDRSGNSVDQTVLDLVPVR